MIYYELVMKGVVVVVVEVEAVGQFPPSKVTKHQECQIFLYKPIRLPLANAETHNGGLFSMSILWSV